MKKVYRKLTKEQKEKEIIFSSTLKTYPIEEEVVDIGIVHEVHEDDPEKNDKIERLKDDKFFNNSHFDYNEIRQ